MLTRIVLVAAWLILTYETVALTLGAWPTITDIVREHRSSPLVVLAVCAAIGALTGWVLFHLLTPGGER